MFQKTQALPPFVLEDFYPVKVSEMNNAILRKVVGSRLGRDFFFFKESAGFNNVKKKLSDAMTSES